jgi:signal recognition particle subunit SRP19
MSAATEIAPASRDHAHDSRVIIYPVYLNANASVADGRKLARSACCDAPHVLEIRDVIEKHLKLPCEIEDKHHSRDTWQRGRVRVTLKKDDGMPLAREISTRGALLTEVARMIPKLPARTPGTSAHKERVARMPTPGEILTQFTSQAGQAGAAAAAARRGTYSRP